MIICPIHEVNDCHVPAGSPAGGQFCGPGYLDQEYVRAQKAGIRFLVDPREDARSSSYRGIAPTWRQDATGKWEAGVSRARIDIGTGADDWKLNRAGILSVARHEMGHATDRPRTSNVPNAAQIINGFGFDREYTAEFAAWRGAIRDSKGRVQWSTVRKSLDSHLRADIRLRDHLGQKLATREREYARILDRHIGILKRYARRVRGRR